MMPTTANHMTPTRKSNQAASLQQGGWLQRSHNPLHMTLARSKEGALR